MGCIIWKESDSQCEKLMYFTQSLISGSHRFAVPCFHGYNQWLWKDVQEQLQSHCLKRSNVNTATVWLSFLPHAAVFLSKFLSTLCFPACALLVACGSTCAPVYVCACVTQRQQYCHHYCYFRGLGKPKQKHLHCKHIPYRDAISMCPFPAADTSFKINCLLWFGPVERSDYKLLLPTMQSRNPANEKDVFYVEPRARHELW